MQAKIVLWELHQGENMTPTSTWSATLTGAVLHNAEADDVWPQVVALLGGDAASLRNRLPVTFKPLDETSVRQQMDELNALGAEAVILPDDSGARLWVRVGERTCGPVSQTYARDAHDRGVWAADVLVCPHGQQDWESLRAWLGLPAAAQAQTPPLFDTGGDQPLPTHMQAPLVHGGFWMRAAAYLIDFMIMCVALFVLAFAGGLLGVIAPSPPIATVLAFELIVMVGMWLYFALFESSSAQATPGKMVLGLRVTDQHGRRIGFGRASGRYFGKILSGMILDIGYMMAGWTERKQGLHDMLANCCVVRATGLAVWSAERGNVPRQGG